ncbi:hypothetical protein [Nocardiopsis sp. RV163]|uniref:hypothetical protein n=1 Tax=Nocardiopsis sp. RV163 TaxID=1661388 RepID=UPI000AC55AB1|nr:hypothetical protein [Nocardiopsis sp. RV163]
MIVSGWAGPRWRPAPSGWAPPRSAGETTHDARLPAAPVPEALWSDLEAEGLIAPGTAS